MKWYQKYLAAYERPYTEVPEGVKQEVARKLKKFSHVEEPVISVVAIAHNEGRHILACLWSLADNAVDLPTEIIVVSNHSTDDTDTILSELGVTWYSETRKSPGFARQCGLDHARGTYHICIDSDTLYPPHYIATHVRYLQQKDVVCTYGLWSFLPNYCVTFISTCRTSTVRNFACEVWYWRSAQPLGRKWVTAQTLSGARMA